MPSEPRENKQNPSIWMIPWVRSHPVNEKWFELHGYSVTHGGHPSLLEPQIKQGVAFQMENCCEQKKACLPISSLRVCSVILLQDLSKLHALPCSMSVATSQSSSSKTWPPSPPSWGSGSRADSVWELDKGPWTPWREVELGLDPASRSECFWFYRQDNTIRRKHLFDSQGCHHQSDPCKSKHQSSLHSWGL